MRELPDDFFENLDLGNLSHEEVTDLVRYSGGCEEGEVTMEVYFTEADADAATGAKELRKAIDGFPPLDAEQAGEAGT